MPNKTEANSMFQKCLCTTHLLEVEHYNDSDIGLEEVGFNITVWRLGNEDKLYSIKERIRWCWHVLTTGKPWADSVILSEEQACNIASFIIRKEQS